MRRAKSSVTGVRNSSKHKQSALHDEIINPPSQAEKKARQQYGIDTPSDNAIDVAANYELGHFDKKGFWGRMVRLGRKKKDA